jgi:hypothetical protein
LFALLRGAWRDMLRKIPWGDRGFDGDRLEVVVVVTYAIYSIVTCLSESAGCVSF